MTYHSTERRHLAVGKSIERAAGELPDGYDILVEIEKNAATVSLLIPPLGDDDGGEVKHDWDGDGLSDYLNSAIDYAIKHHAEHKD